MDVTERDLARIQLQEAFVKAEKSRNRVDNILRSITDGLIVTDLENRIILLNPAAETMFGITLEASAGQPLFDLLRDENLQKKFEEAFEVNAGGFSFDFELSWDTSQNPRIMRVRTSEMKGGGGRHSGIITIIFDVTHEQEVDRMKTEFVSTAAHELRTPLTSIQGFSELLLVRDNFSEKERSKYLTYINKQAVVLGKIINDLLDISSIEFGRGFTLNKVPCDAGDTIRQTVPYFEEQYKKHRFEVMLPGEPVELSADEEKVVQVLKNLLSNAAKYSPDGGLIRVIGENWKTATRCQSRTRVWE